MSVSASFDSPSATSQQEGIEASVSKCLERTLTAFADADLATDEENARLRLRLRGNPEEEEDDTPKDLIELLAKIQGTEEERMGIETARISQAVADVISPTIPLIPFGGKLMAPSAFYESYTQLHELSKALLSPVIFAEDTDAIGTGALNPIAAQIMGEEILTTVNRRFGIRPFITSVRLDYESWAFLARKHFEL